MTCSIYLGSTWTYFKFQSNEYFARTHIKFVGGAVNRSKFRVLSITQHLVLSSFTIITAAIKQNALFMHKIEVWTRKNRIIFIQWTKETKRTPFPWKFLSTFLFALFRLIAEFIWMENCLWQTNCHLNEWNPKMQLLRAISLIQLIYWVNEFDPYLNVSQKIYRRNPFPSAK